MYMLLGSKTPPRAKTPPTPEPEPPKDDESSSRPSSGILKSPKRVGSAASRKSSGRYGSYNLFSLMNDMLLLFEVDKHLK